MLSLTREFSVLLQPSMFHHGIAGSQVLYNGGLPSQKNLITEQARQILNENELGTLKYYLDEYCKGFIDINAFVLALFDLLDTPAKAGFCTFTNSPLSLVTCSNSGVL